MASYYTYNPIEKRMEIVIEDYLAVSFPHEDVETGHTYLMYNPNNNQLEYYSGGAIVRSFEE